MELVRVTKKELKQEAGRMLASGAGTVAITPQRAASQSENPFAADDDILLLYAKDPQGNIAGYAGILPGILNGRTSEKIFWNSCWYADPEYGGQVSVPLLTEFLRVTGQRVLFSDLSEKTAAIIGRLGGFTIRQRQGIILRMRSSLHHRAMNRKGSSLRNRVLRFAAMTGLLKLTDSLFNAGRNLRLSKFRGKIPDGVTSAEFDFPDAGQLEFIRNISSNAITRPAREQVEWWMESFWLTKKDESNRSLENRYFFSAFARDFHYLWFEAADRTSRLGIALLTFRDGTVKTPYLWFEPDRKEDFFSALLHFILSGEQNKVLITFHEEFSRFVALSSPRYLPRQAKTRYTAVADRLTAIAGIDFGMQDGDGDYLFT